MSYSKILNNILNKDKSDNLQVEVAFDKYRKEQRTPTNPTFPGGSGNVNNGNKPPKPEKPSITDPTRPGGDGGGDGSVSGDGGVSKPDGDTPSNLPPTNAYNQYFYGMESSEIRKSMISSYYDTPLINATPEIVKKITSAEYNIPNSRKIEPPSYYNYIQYEHRSSMDYTSLRIGDVQFNIPPEFIAVTETTPSDSVNSIRQRGSLKVKRGYTKRSVTIQLFVNGYEQVNGYAVEAPSGEYYVDGLRSLFAQFITTPFVSITNEFLNNQYDIYTAAVSGILITTLDGFPGCYEVHINLEHITMTPYTEIADCLYEEIINWDLYRYNYQRLLVKEINTSKTFLPKMKNFKNNNFKLKILNQEVLNGYKNTIEDDKPISEDLYNDSCFDVMIDNEKQNFEITGISINASNNIPLMQLSSQNIPIAQYLGSSDIGFNLIIETTNRDVIHALKTANTLSQYMTRHNKEFGTFGFLKVENELINMVGVEFIIIEDIQTSTVPNFPGLFKIVINCVEYDYRQADRENFVGMLPFDEGTKGTKDDAISQNAVGWLNKIKQENTIEAKMSRVEMYPDLQLPLYVEVDKQIKLINEFREKHELELLSMDFLDKTYSITPGETVQGAYGLYVDPDFYINYPLDYDELNDEIFEQVKGPKKAKPVTTVGQVLAHGEDLPDGSFIDSEGNLHYVTGGSGGGSSTDGSSSMEYDKVTGNALADILIAKCEEGCGYVFGSDGQISTSGKWKGKQVFDCSGFISWGLRELKLMTGRSNDAGLMSSAYSTRVSKSELKPGDFVRYVGHIGVYIGNDKIVEAANSEAGVRIGPLYGKFDQFARPKNVPNSKSSSKKDKDEEKESRIQSRRPTFGTSGNEVVKYDVSEKRIQMLGRHLYKKLKGTEEQWVKYGHKYDVNPIFCVAISKSETEHGEKLWHNNPGGLMKSTGGLMRFATLEDGIQATVRNLRNLYLNDGLDTIEKVGSRYCPIGAENDPLGLNKNWVPNVTSNYKNMAGELPKRLDYKGFGEVSSDYSGSSASAGSGSSSTVEKITTPWAGKTLGERVYDLTIENFGKPIFNESPITYIVKHDEASEEVRNKIKWLTNKLDISSQSSVVINKTAAKAFGFEMPKGPLRFIWDEAVNEFGSVIGWGLDTIDKFVEKDFDEALMKFYKDEVRTYKTMFCDMMMYSKNGTVCRAFPTYNLLIADDSGDWLDARKLWSNYYLYKSVISIDIHQERSQPAHTAKLQVTNIHHNLNSKKKNQEISTDIENDPEYSWIAKEFYKLSGILMGTPKLTEDMVNVKNTLYGSINLKPGAKIHIRIGYGSNPIMLPIVFNGVISEMNNGDVVEIVAESYGTELINSILSSDEDTVNNIFNIGSEPTNVIYEILNQRDGTFANTLSKKWGETSRYGIENFGITRDYLRIDALEDSGKNYDLMKNVYFAKYDSIPFCHGAFLNLDGEDNANFFLYNKTPWDAMQVITQTLPEFVCQPMYHQFDCRLFFGLPYVLSKYRYDISKKCIYDSAKTFSQFHYIDSLSNIIDNQIITTSQELSTNCIAMYTLGEGIKSSPTVYSDRTIYTSHQKTKTIDTTLSQDYFGWDFLYEKTIAPVAKSAAIKMAASSLIESWNRNYSGDIIIIGDTSIKPCDYLYINDMYSQMQGLTTVRQVVHSINSSGFITSIQPDMLAINTMKNSGQGNVIKSLTSFGASYGAVKTARQATIESVEPMSLSISLFRSLASLRYECPEIYTAITSVVDIKLGKSIIKSMKLGETLQKYSTVTTFVSTNAKKLMGVVNGLETVDKFKNLKYVKPILTGVKGAGMKLAAWGTAVAPGIGTVVGWIVGTVIIDTILGAIIDEFAYNNTIKLFPLAYKDGPFVSGCNGQANLLTGIAETSDVDEDGNKMPSDED